jgi:hypothetical protein
MNFTDHLSFILEDSPSKCSKNLDDAYEIIRDIDRANQHIIMLQNRLRILKRKINGELAIQIRKHHPALNISVNPKQCKIGYKSKYLSFYPDIEKGVWQINGEDPKFINRFKKLYRRNTIISPEITDLVSSISDFFTNHYKSLGESIVGKGAIIIEGKSGDLQRLSEYSNKTSHLWQEIG